MDKNWQHRFIERHPCIWWLMNKVVDGVLFTLKVWLAIAVGSIMFIY